MIADRNIDFDVIREPQSKTAILLTVPLGWPVRHHERFWPLGVPDIADGLFWIILERFRAYLVSYGDPDVHFSSYDDIW